MMVVMVVVVVIVVTLRARCSGCRSPHASFGLELLQAAGM
jgi:hypothetical protein